MLVTQKELAECLRISTRQARNLKTDGLFQEAMNGRKYDLAKCVAEYIEFKVKAETGRSALISIEQVKAQHEEVRKQISIMKLRQLRRELHEAADVEAFLSDMLIRFKNTLLSTPSKMAMKVAGEKTLTRSSKQSRMGCTRRWTSCRHTTRTRLTGRQKVHRTMTKISKMTRGLRKSEPEKQVKR